MVRDLSVCCGLWFGILLDELLSRLGKFEI